MHTVHCCTFARVCLYYVSYSIMIVCVVWLIIINCYLCGCVYNNSHQKRGNYIFKLVKCRSVEDWRLWGLGIVSLSNYIYLSLWILKKKWLKTILFIQITLFSMIFRAFHFLVYFTIHCDKPKVMYKLVDKHYVLAYSFTCQIAMHQIR